MKKVIILIIATLLMTVAACGYEQPPNESTEQSIENQEIRETVNEVDLSNYFDGMNGTAVFYHPESNEYIIHQLALSEKRSSPCSTFKIIAGYMGLLEGIVNMDHSVRQWSGETYWNSDWNRDLDFQEAFKTSSVWYFRQLINDLGAERVQGYLNQLQYGNYDISDWEGRLNTNNNNRDLTGFWIESSLLISPKEQTEVLKRIMDSLNTPDRKGYLSYLKQAMLIEEGQKDGPTIYGKTGMGKKAGKTVDAWFVGMYEDQDDMVYFAVRLDDPENKEVSSKKARAIALAIISSEQFFVEGKNGNMP